MRKTPVFAAGLILFFQSTAATPATCLGGNCPTITVIGVPPPERNIHNMIGFLGQTSNLNCKNACHGAPDSMCATINASQPPGCSRDTPPKSPEHDPYWRPNGCGDGSFSSNFASIVINTLGGGDLDSPLPGISFRSACNRHDYCYGIAGHRPGCDSRFRSDLQAICASHSSRWCSGLANSYADAVRDHGKAAYDKSVKELQCDTWNSLMDACLL